MEKEKNEVRLFLIYFLLSLLLVYFSRGAFFKKVRGFFEPPVLWGQRVVYSWRQDLELPLRAWKERKTLYEENLKLKEKWRNLAAETGELAACREENEQMRHLLAAPLPANWHFIPGRVIGRFERLKINIGSKAGVSPGMAVVSQNLLVGKVETVEDYSSLLLPLTQAKVKIPVVIRPGQEASGAARGMVEGQGEGLILSEVLQSEGVKEGDLVFTSGEGDWLPDLLIGEVGPLEKGPEKVFQKAPVRYLLDLANLRYLFVVRVFEK